ncbi:MAG: D-glycero-beta-D-manno-heptose 1,7-bisphosphate 7-phosphatase [Clostridia bacterium]|nr:D-glycero-beta-D-manno-heptose 1,7-bisphosphate 7-phosphatase [Clostridia bacterium]
MEAIILAGGFGTRLSGCVSDLPKPLAPVGGRPFLHYILDYLYVNGVHRAVISTGYMAEKIENTIGNRHRGMVVDYCREDTPLGTGGAIRKALGMCREEYAVVINGDTFYDVDLFEMQKIHRESGYPITLAAKTINNVERSGFLQIENGMLTGFCEKGASGAGLINGGIYFINKNALDFIDTEKFSFEKQVLETLILPVRVFESDAYFIDIGIPEEFARADSEAEMLKSKRKRRAVFLDRDGTLNVDTHHLYRVGDFRFIDGADEAVAYLKKNGYLVTVITNQAGIAKNLYKPVDVDILHRHIDSLLCEKHSVVLDGYYYCPHHPQAVIEEYRCSCQCRKPEAGMILGAIADFSQIGIEIDTENSFTVGNRHSDLLAGINAGIKHNILVGSDEPDAADIASAYYKSLKDFSDLEQVLKL